MLRSIILLASILLLFPTTVLSGYQPEALLSASSNFLNHQISIYGPEIKDIIDKQPIPPIQFNGTQNGTHIYLSLKNTKQSSEINFDRNIIKINDAHRFTINSKNINVTIDGQIEFKIGLLPKQKGQLVIKITKLETDTTLSITQPKCSTSQKGIGFDIQVDKVYIHAEKYEIQIQNKGFDNLVINTLKKLIDSRLPSIIQNQIIGAVNPLVTEYSCQGIEEVLSLGSQTYIVIVNTTELPAFNTNNNYLNFYVDLTFINQLTNKTNDEVSNINLPETTEFYDKSNLTVVISSNMLNSILWLIDDSKFLNTQIQNEALTTSIMSILIPSLNTHWPSRPVILGLQTSNKFSHLYFRNGKIITAISLQTQFIVNITGFANQTTQECLETSRCKKACSLNITALGSVAVKIQQQNNIKGLLDTLQIAQITVIDQMQEINIDVQTLQEIISNLLPAYRPQINQILQEGYPLPIDPSSTYNISEVMLNTYKSHTAVGITLVN